VAPIIQAENVTKVYRIGKVDVPALRGVSFSVEKGEFVTIVGPSGSGKSTLFYILGGLTRATSGRVTIDGEDFAQLSDAQRTAMRKKKIGFVFQKFNLLPTLTAKGNIEIAREIAGKNGVDKKLFDQVTQMLGIAGRLDHRPSELSACTPAILFSGKTRFYEKDTRADLFLPKGMYAPIELLERIRLMLVKKRGPKRLNSVEPPRMSAAS